jgi:ribosomal protein L29
MKKAITEIRGETSAELQAKLNDLRKEQFELRFRGAEAGGKTTRAREVRHTIARILMVLGDRAREGGAAAPAAGGKPAVAKAAAKPAAAKSTADARTTDSTKSAAAKPAAAKPAGAKPAADKPAKKTGAKKS